MCTAIDCEEVVLIVPTDYDRDFDLVNANLLINEIEKLELLNSACKWWI